MEQQLTTRQRKVFYKISKWMLIYYIIIFALSIVIAVLNYFASAVGIDTEPFRISSIVLATFSSVLIIVFWFVGRSQQDRLHYVMSKKSAWVCNLFVDLLEIGYIVLTTITSLYNGQLFKEFDVGISIVTLLLLVVSAVNTIFSLVYFILARKKAKTKLDF